MLTTQNMIDDICQHKEPQDNPIDHIEMMELRREIETLKRKNVEEIDAL